MMQRCGWILVIAGALLLTGCGETEMTIWLNPDGSGRATIRQAMHPMMEGATSGRQLTNRVANLIAKTSGVEAWQDITLERTDKGPLMFQGTAYFSDIEQLHMPMLIQDLRFEWLVPVGGQAGRLAIRHAPPEDAKVWEAVPEATWRAVPQAQIEAWRDDYRHKLAIVPWVMAVSPVTIMVHLPGSITDASNLEQVDAHSVRLALDPLDWVESWIGVVRDDAMIARALTLEPDADPDRVNRHTLGMAFAALGPHSVSVESDREPWFDYASTVEAVLAGEAAMWERLGREDDFALPVTLASEGAHLLGAVWKREVIADDAGRWAWGRPTCRVQVRAELGEVPEGSVQAHIHSARCPSGHSLVTGDRVRLAPHQIAQSADRRAVLLSIDLAAPPSGETVVAELAGVIEFHVKRGDNQIDLGFSTLAPGATGTRFEARIERIGRGLWGATSGETLRFAISRRSGLQLRGIAVVTPDGRTLPCTHRSWYLSAERGFEIMLREGGALPRDATIVLDVRQPPRRVELPFAFADIPIHSGRPGELD